MADSIRLDPTDLKGMIELMDKYGDSQTLYPGENDEGELVHIFIFHDMIVTETLQSNNWIRKNIYYRDGSREELYSH